MDEIDEELNQLDYESAPISNAPVSNVPQQPTAPPARGRKFKIIGLAAALAMVLLGGGYIAYAKLFAAPERIWQKAFINAQSLASGTLGYSVSYSEKIPAGMSADAPIPFTGDLVFTLSGSSDFNDAGDLSSKSRIDAKLGDLNLGFETEVRKIGSYFYYKTSGNPLALLFGAGSQPEIKSEWYKRDLAKDEDLQNISKTEGQLRSIIKDAKVIKLEKYLGVETISGEASAHYQAAVDKTELARYLAETLKLIASKETISFEPMINKLDFRKTEVWIGKKDKQFRQILLETNFPGIVSGSLGDARRKSRDAKRLADIRQIQIALELFFNDNNRYPTAENGFPSLTDGSTKFSTYMPNLHNAPKPADGPCSMQENFYWYEQQSAGQSYSLKFCLGGNTGGYKAGVVTASPLGIGPFADGLGAASYDLKPEDFPLTAVLSLKFTFTNHNQAKTIEIPANAIEMPAAPVMPGTDWSTRSNDSLELANIRQVQTALELYFNDNNRYPKTLKDMGQYIELVKTPKNTSGECAGINPDYSYAPSPDGQKYTMQFCLFTATSGYTAGKHKVSQAGIE